MVHGETFLNDRGKNGQYEDYEALPLARLQAIVEFMRTRRYTCIYCCVDSDLL